MTSADREAVRATHRPTWVWRWWRPRRICSCGFPLPCPDLAAALERRW